LFSKPVIFVVISLLAVALVYSSFSFSVYAVPPDPGFDSNGTCGGITTNPRTGNNAQTCCWTERVPGKLPPSNKATYCQTCEYTAAGYDCKPKQQQLVPASGVILPEDGVLQQPIPPPTGPVAPLQGGGILQQPTTTTPTTPPPLFGRNVPLQGGGVFGQQPAAIVPPSPVLTPVPPILTPEPPVPMFGSAQDATPTPPPQFGQIAPQGQVSPSLGEETQEQATEEQTTEEDEQVIAKDDDDGPVPPECPTTGPIPPDCTMKPKFPEERAIE
jgi:hypothetical protein